MTEGHVYAVASGKGGVGKTTTAVNLGAAFVDAGREVVVVDVDLGMANLEDFLDVDSVDVTLHDVLAGRAAVEDAITAAPGDFDAVLGSSEIEAFGRADPAGLGAVISSLRERYDVVVLDGGGGLSHDVSVPLGLADGVIIVTTPTNAAITNAEKTRDLVERLDGTIEGLVVSRIGGAGRATPEVVADRLDLPVLGSVPEDGAIQMSADEGTPLVAIDRESPAAQSYREIAYGLLDEPLPRDWAEDSANPMDESVTPGSARKGGSGDSGGTSTESLDRSTTESADSPDDEKIGTSIDEPTADPSDDQEAPSADDQETPSADESEPTIDEPESSARDEPADTSGAEPVEISSAETAETPAEGNDERPEEHPQSGIAETLETMEGGTEVEENASETVDVIPGPAESPADDSDNSKEEGSFLSRLFGGLFG